MLSGVSSYGVEVISDELSRDSLPFTRSHKGSGGDSIATTHWTRIIQNWHALRYIEHKRSYYTTPYPRHDHGETCAGVEGRGVTRGAEGRGWREL